MKRLLIALLLVLPITMLAETGNLFALSDSTSDVTINVEQSVIPDSVDLTMNMVYQDIKEGINALALGLKVTAEHVYGVLVTQQIVNSIMWLVVDLLLIVVSLIMLKITFSRDGKYINNSGTDITAKGAWLTGTILMAVLTIAIILGSLTIVITGFVNPEYGAIQEILTVIK